MAFNINAMVKQAEKDYGLSSGGSFKAKEGANKLRFLSNFVPHSSMYKGKPTFKIVTWVFDYADSRVKLYFMPKTIAEMLGALQENTDYAFDEMPMPYDVTITAKGAGTREVEYQIVAARSNTPVSAEALEQLGGKESIEAVLEKLKEKEAEEGNAVQTQPSAPQEAEDGEVKLADIPF